MNYVQKYRLGMHGGFQSTLRQALDNLKQQEGLRGQASSPAARAAYVRGIMAPYLEQYYGGYERASEKDVEQARYDKEMDFYKDQLKAQEEAAEIQGITEVGQLGILGGFALKGKTGATPAAGPWGAYGGAKATGATAGATTGATVGAAGPWGAYGGGTTAAGPWGAYGTGTSLGATASTVAGPALLGSVVGAEVGERTLRPVMGKTGGRLTGATAAGAGIGTMIAPGVGTAIGAGIGAGYGFFTDYGTLKRLIPGIGKVGSEVGQFFKRPGKKITKTVKKIKKKIKFW